MEADIIMVDGHRISISSILEISEIFAQEGPVSNYTITHVDGSISNIVFDVKKGNLDLFLNTFIQLKEAVANSKTLRAQATQRIANPRICEIPGLGVFDLKKILQISEPFTSKRAIKVNRKPERENLLIFTVSCTNDASVAATDFEVVVNDNNPAPSLKLREKRNQLIEAWKKYHNQ